MAHKLFAMSYISATDARGQSVVAHMNQAQGTAGGSKGRRSDPEEIEDSTSARNTKLKRGKEKL